MNNILVDLRNQVEILKQQMKEKDDQIQMLQFNVSKLIDVITLNQNSINQSTFLIPMGKTWEPDCITKCTLQGTQYGSIKVSVNSVFLNWESCHPKNLFNGKLENSPADYGWTSNQPLPSFIQIEFGIPVVANVLSMTSRKTYLKQSPKTFEIQAKNDNEQFRVIKTITNENWQQSENKLFSFNNSNAFKYYKIIFTETMDVSVSTISIVELNLGHLFY